MTPEELLAALADRFDWTPGYVRHLAEDPHCLCGPDRDDGWFTCTDGDLALNRLRFGPRTRKEHEQHQRTLALFTGIYGGFIQEQLKAAPLFRQVAEDV